MNPTIIPVALDYLALSLAIICLGGPSVMLAVFYFDCKWDAKGYNKERDLP